ncbi:hypothetical protein BDM02DRAFT_3194001 [Thelephora ganbajun]|uniref:Uncharacterized protein n=1 Tax=Thelephora ganbajun TaxID=370292 RepID=A0ACB6YXT1_THEGA|nr:hypothetical protein BDM02DRAFT_3194001 [Thelephora ganbajun]
MVKGTRVYPGIKDLPVHIHENFHNEFICFVIKQVANSKSPWINPDIDSLQLMYQLIYLTFPACLWHSDAVHHPKTITSLGVLCNRVATDAVTAKRLLNTKARAQYIAGLFRSDDDHPIIWQEYVEGNIQNHPEISGYKMTRCGVFQSDPILETLLGYYSSSGIKEDPPTEDPGPGNRPLGILALATAMVECAYKMYATRDFIESKQRFDAEFYNPRTA